MRNIQIASYEKAKLHVTAFTSKLNPMGIRGRLIVFIQVRKPPLRYMRKEAKLSNLETN